MKTPPATVAGKPVAPAHLDKRAKKEFARIVTALDESGTLSLHDADSIALYATLYSQWVEALALIEEKGLIVLSPNGYPLQSPYLNIANHCEKRMSSLLSEFGLTPASRSKVNAAPKEDESAKKWEGLA